MRSSVRRSAAGDAKQELAKAIALAVNAPGNVSSVSAFGPGSALGPAPASAPPPLSKKDVFLAELALFHKSTGAPIRNKPIINGREVDLYLLHTLIQNNGGWLKLNSQGLWDTLLKDLGLPSPCVNGGVAIRQIYLRYLERWDRSKNASLGIQGGGDGDIVNTEADDERPRRGVWGTPKPRNTVAQTYNHTQHVVPEHIRESVGLAPLQRLGGSPERLTLSLLSPFPNEQDFALNVCTILAVDNANKLPVISCPHIVDFLLGHVAVYNHPSLRDVIGTSYKEARKIDMKWFWEEHSRPTAILELLEEDKFPIHGLAMQALVSEINLSSCLSGNGIGQSLDEKDTQNIEEFISVLLGDDDGIIASYCNGGARDVITRRVSQVATVMRNLSFHDDNLGILAKNQTFIRFTILCANTSMSSIRQMGLDALGNVAQDMTVKDPAVCILSKHLFSTLSTSMASDDRARILFALEVLNKLAQNEANEDVLLRCLEQKMYEQVCSYLTLHDIMLLVVTLECMYALTTLGEKACDYIVRVHGVMDTLVSLITVEAQSYGPKACILMRVVETVPGGHLPSQFQPQVALPPRPLTPPNSNPSNFPSSVQLQLQNISHPQQLIQTTQQGQSQQIIMQNLKPGTNIQATNVTVQQQHAQQQVLQENEQFALAWLRTSWEPCATNIRLDASELYKQYMTCCAKVGRKGFINQIHFPRCVRSVFGGMVGPNSTKGPNGEMQQYYMGIRQRPSVIQNKQQPAPNIKSGPASPILKAQLSKIEQLKPQINTHPHLSLALEGGVVNPAVSPPPLQPTIPVLIQTTATTQNITPASNPAPPSTPNNTTLIKHLLAHKVSAAPSTFESDRMIPQVAQRQNQQRLLGQAGSQTPALTPTTSANTPTAMEMDAEALISCNTITSSGVTSTSPAVNPLAVNVPPLAPLSQGPVENIDTPKLEIPASNSTPSTGDTIVNNNKMLTDLLEKQSAPPIIPSVPQTEKSETESAIATIKTIQDDIDEPEAKKPRESVSSKAANLYAALAADALEDEEELLLAQADSGTPATTISAPTVVVEDPTVAPVIAAQGIQTVATPAATVIPQQIVAPETVQEPEPAVRQVIVPTLTNQNGQLILHAAPGKPVVGSNIPATQFITQPTGQIQLIASPNPQGMGYVSQGVMQHKTIIIVQNGAGGNPITLTVNNPGSLDEATLSNIISQATEMLSQQQANQSAVMQTTSGLLQTSTGVIQTNQPTPGLIQTNIAGQQPILHAGGLIKHQIGQGQPQLISNQQNQPQLQQIIVQGNQAILTNPSLIAGNQKIMVGNQQIMMGNQQIVVGNQPIIAASQQQVITGQLINNSQQFGTQQIVSVSQPFQGLNQQQIVTTGQQQQRILSGNQIIIDQQGNRQIVSSGPSQGIIISNQTVNNAKVVSGQTVVGAQQLQINVTNQTTPNKMTSNQPEAQIAMVQPPSPQKVPDEPWVCQWRGCNQVFESASAVYSHACSVHCLLPESPCLWAYCDQLPRKKFSLMTHLQDRHCNAEALKASLAQRRKGIIPQVATVQGNPSSTMERIDSPGPDAPTGITHPGYAPNAALHAIKRHAVDFLNPRELMHRAEASRNASDTPDDNEGPVTKSIRLTAALILRNIVLYSHSGKRLLRGYEPHLAGIALSSVEASRTVAQVLYDMNSI